MTNEERIEQLEMEKRLLITQLVKARTLLRRVHDELWAANGQPWQSIRDDTKALLEELRS